jgi:hypothetical protein
MRTLSDFILKLLTRLPMARWSAIPLRLIVGYGFMQHGFAKLSRGPDMFAAILHVSADIKHSRYCRFCLHKVAGRPGGRHTTTTAQAGPNSVRLKIAR